MIIFLLTLYQALYSSNFLNNSIRWVLLLSPILYMSGLRVRDHKQLDQGHRVRKQSICDMNPGMQLQQLPSYQSLGKICFGWNVLQLAFIHSFSHSCSKHFLRTNCMSNNELGLDKRIGMRELHVSVKNCNPFLIVI